MRTVGAALLILGAIPLPAAPVILTCPVTGGARQASAARDEAVLRELQQALAKAWVGGDRTTIERIIGSDWTSTGPDGRTTDRARVLVDVFDTRVHRIHRLEITDVRVRVFGDAAVVTGRTHGTGEFDGTPYDVVIRFTDTFVRRAGEWQAVASHASLVPDDGEAAHAKQFAAPARVSEPGS